MQVVDIKLVAVTDKQFVLGTIHITIGSVVHTRHIMAAAILVLDCTSKGRLFAYFIFYII